jgi:hypothetical protein
MHNLNSSMHLIKNVIHLVFQSSENTIKDAFVSKYSALKSFAHFCNKIFHLGSVLTLPKHIFISSFTLCNRFFVNFISSLEEKFWI